MTLFCRFAITKVTINIVDRCELNEHVSISDNCRTEVRILASFNDRNNSISIKIKLLQICKPFSDNASKIRNHNVTSAWHVNCNIHLSSADLRFISSYCKYRKYCFIDTFNTYHVRQWSHILSHSLCILTIVRKKELIYVAAFIPVFDNTWFALKEMLERVLAIRTSMVVNGIYHVGGCAPFEVFLDSRL